MILTQPPTGPAPETAGGRSAPRRFEVDAILFDIDGTLVDSTPAVVRSWRAWCEAHDVDLDELLSVSHGRRSEDTIAMFLPASGSRSRWSSSTGWNSATSTTSRRCLRPPGCSPRCRPGAGPWSPRATVG
ncbi:HAD family hydrolase [Tessaracoccus coleopterorum]|uniref:HAD family hydrolase n=1 Tax=Tessaracoccus coleopterorum TaxID=2714950 RepID=UPI0018D45D82|nr:HAD family hydrolase [Tessaracoccus coleopterorum]